MLRSAGLSTSSVGRKHARRGQQLRAPSTVHTESIKEQQVRIICNVTCVVGKLY